MGNSPLPLSWNPLKTGLFWLVYLAFDMNLYFAHDHEGKEKSLNICQQKRKEEEVPVKKITSYFLVKFHNQKKA